jgi:hypothetical protein
MPGKAVAALQERYWDDAFFQPEQTSLNQRQHDSGELCGDQDKNKRFPP